MNQLARISPANARLPQSYESAKVALANCVRLDECKDWADKAAALASYAKQANDEELMKQATRIRDRAIRRAGELLKQIEPARGSNQNIRDYSDPKVLTRKDAGEAAGFSDRQTKTALRVANIPAADFERQVESSKPPTVSKLAEQGKRPAPQPVIDLKGRDPQAFNRSLHFIAEIEEYAAAITRANLDLILPGLIPSEAKRIQKFIADIDAIHDRIVTRI
jgi:hypothetical protein